MNRTLSTSAVRRIVFDTGLAVATVLVTLFLVLGYAQTVLAAAPASHSDYSDIEEGGNYFRDYIDYLIDEEVLEYDTGCVDGATSPEGFCPDEGMPRWQVAVIIARALNGGDDPASLSTATFADVDIDDSDVWWAPHVEFIAEEGITAGCGEDSDDNKLFCPDSNTSRAQMASLLKKAFDVPESDMEDVFADVTPGSSHADAIDDIAGDEALITFGCGWRQAGFDSKEDYEADGNRYYCPDDSRRDQLVTLLARAMRWQDGLETDLDPEPEAISTDSAAAPAGGKPDGSGQVPEAGAAASADDFLVGSLFIGLLTASVICGRIYLDTRKRQGSHTELA